MGSAANRASESIFAAAGSAASRDCFNIANFVCFRLWSRFLFHLRMDSMTLLVVLGLRVDIDCFPVVSGGLYAIGSQQKAT